MRLAGQQEYARLEGAGGIHCVAAAGNIADDSFGVYNEGCAFGDAQKAEHAVLSADLLPGITKQRKGQAQLLREAAVGLRLVDTDAEYLGA